MHLFFVDESGTAPPPKKMTTRYFVVGGVVIPEDQWHHIENDLTNLKNQYSIQGEIKWRYFGQKVGQEQQENNLKHLERTKRDEFRSLIFGIINKYQSMRVIVTVTSIEVAYQQTFIQSQEDLYWNTYKPLTERFQYHLQDLSRTIGSKINGIVICDHRESNQDDNLRKLHAKLLNIESSDPSKYENLIEGLFIAPSHLSIGIQFADMVVGAVFRKFEHNDEKWFNLLEPSWRKSSDGVIDGFGLIKFPKKGWK